VAGQVEEYDAYYNQQHVPDILRVPGVVDARRLRATAAGRAAEVPTFATEIDVDGDPGEVLATIVQRMGGPDMPGSEAVDSKLTRAWVLTDHPQAR
jgi:hypothetical protein